MTVSLQAFLETYPYKTKACLEHICSALGISTNGTVVTLRTRIVEYGENKAKDNENLEEKIKDMAHKFKEHKKNGSLSKTPKGVNPKYPLSPVALLSSAPHSTPIAQASSSLPITTELAAPGAPTMTEPGTPSPQQQQQQQQDQQQQLQKQQQPLEPQPTSQLLFDDSQTILECESRTADPEMVGRRIDELDQMFEELTLHGDEDFPGVMEARKRRMNHPFTHIDQSLWYEDEVGSGNSGGSGVADAGNDGNPADEAKNCLPDFEKRMQILLDRAIVTVASKDSQIEMLECQLNKVVDVTGRMIEKTDSYMGRILSNSEMTNQMVLNLKNEMQMQSTKVTQLEETISAREKALEQAQKQTRSSEHEVQMQSAKIAQLEEAVQARDRELEQAREQIKQFEQSFSDQLKGTTEQLNEVLRKMDEHEQKLSGQSINSRLLNIASSSAPPVPSTSPSTTVPLPLPSKTSVPQVALSSSSPSSSSSLASKSTAQKSQAESMSATSSSPPVTNGAKPTAGRTREVPDNDRLEEVIIVVTDSNGKHLNPELLHDTKKVVVERRATWEMARDHMPKPPYPASVTDVVLVTGINNVMNENQQISDILQIADATARMYQNAFPNATIHLGSIAPANERCLNYNFNLQDLAAHRKAPFITIEDMYDRGNGQLKPNVLNGIHFTKVGIRPLAKQIKRSLYRKRTVPMLDPPNHQAFPQMQQRPARAYHAAHPSQNAAMILETFFNIAKACLPQQ